MLYHKGPQDLLKDLDVDLRAELLQEMAQPARFRQITHRFRRRIEIEYNASVSSIERSSNSVLVHLGTHRAVVADAVLSAIGRRPNIQALGLSNLNLPRIDRHSGLPPLHSGDVATPQLPASARNDRFTKLVFVGDCRGRNLQLKPLAEVDGIKAAQYLSQQLQSPSDTCTTKSLSATHSSIPVLVWFFPFWGWWGLGEMQAAAEHPHIASVKLPCTGIMSAKLPGLVPPAHHFVKLVFCRQTGNVYGVHVFSNQAPALLQFAADFFRVPGSRSVVDLDAHLVLATTPFEIFRPVARLARFKMSSST